MPNPISTLPRLAVTFGSSFLGFATHFGFLRELLAGGRRPVAVAGSSAGAIVAVETITPRPWIGVPITFWPPKPWPGHARDLMALGASSARRLLG